MTRHAEPRLAEPSGTYVLAIPPSTTTVAAGVRRDSSWRSPNVYALLTDLVMNASYGQPAGIRRSFSEPWVSLPRPV